MNGNDLCVLVSYEWWVGANVADSTKKKNKKNKNNINNCQRKPLFPALSQCFLSLSLVYFGGASHTCANEI